MIPSQAIFERPDVLLAADTSTLAVAANPPRVVLFKAPFTPSPDLVFADLVPADFDGYTDTLCQTGAQRQTLDPNTGDSLVQMIAPLGGWQWETTGLTNLPQSIYGWGLVPNGSASVYGSELFDVPVLLDGINQQVQIPQVQYRRPAGSTT